MPNPILENRFYRQLQDAEEEKPVVEDVPEEEEVVEVAKKEEDVPFGKHNFLVHHDTHPLVLDVLLLSKYGTDWLDWEPETIIAELKDDFRQSGISTLNWQQIQAVKTCHNTEAPWKAWEVFCVVCQALNNNIPNFHMVQKPTIAQVMVALDIMGRIDKHSFSEEVAKFVAASFLDEGVYYLPPPANFAQEWASAPRYRCAKCGKVDRDDDNYVCDTCGAPESDLKKEYERDWRPVKTRYDEIVAQGEDHDMLQETVVDVQVAKLLVARDYVLYRRHQLKKQLKVVQDAKLF
jgi:hypothetical protein